MNKCIYLKKTDSEATFQSEEHIIPAGIGGIKKLAKGMVCDEFNTSIFSPIELDFMRNSIIVLPRQFHGPGKRGSLSATKASKSAVHLMSQDGSFKDASLGYIKLAKPCLIPQIKLYGDTGQFIFDLNDGDYKLQLKQFINDLKEFNDKYSILYDNKLPEGCLIIGLHEQKWYVAIKSASEKLELKDLIHKVLEQIKICDEEPWSEKAQITSQQTMGFKMDYFGRVCGKIAFNFLAYSQGADFALDKRFDPIRDWIVHGGDNKFVDFLKEAPLRKEIIHRVRLLESGHTILIGTLNKKIYGYVCFYGHFQSLVTICDNFKDKHICDGFICDWENKKEYRLLDYISTI